MKVPHSILLSLAKDIGADWDIDYQLDLGLVIDLPVIGNFTIPLSQKGEIKLPTLYHAFAFDVFSIFFLSHIFYSVCLFAFLFFIPFLWKVGGKMYFFFLF